MKKQVLHTLLEQFNSARNERADTHQSILKKDLIKSFSEDVYTIFVALNRRNRFSEEVYFNDIQHQCQLIWSHIHQTILSYTSIPEAAVTRFLIRVALEALQAQYPDTPPALVQLIKFLIPTLILNEVTTLYVPADYGYQINQAEITALEFNEDKASMESTVTHFLKTHLIADSGEYIIPLWVINKPDLINKKLNNVYYEQGQDYQASIPWQLTAAECTRLWRHNYLTRLIAEINQRIEGYEQNSSNLYGQLVILGKSLYFNSVNGVGTEIEAGSGAELAIRRFYSYYTKLDLNALEKVLTPELKEELMKLRHCIGVYFPGEKSILPIETCMATRSASLRSAMLYQEPLLASIGLSQSTLSRLIQEDQDLRDQQLIALNLAIQNNTLSGSESLPVSKKIIDYYHIVVAVDSFQSLFEYLDDLSTTELNDFISNGDVTSWINAINSIENWVIILSLLPLDKLTLLLHHLGEPLKQKLLNNARDYFSLLILLPPERQLLVIQYLIELEELFEQTVFEKNLLMASPWDTQLFQTLWNLLTPQQRLKAIRLKNADNEGNGETLAHRLSQTPENLAFFFKLLPKMTWSGKLNLLMKQDVDGDTVLHTAALVPKSLQIILHFLPVELRLKLIHCRNNEGKTVLHLAAKTPESIKVIYQYIPSRYTLTIVKSRDQKFRTILHKAVSQSDVVKMTLEAISPEERLPLLEIVNKQGVTAFHRALEYPDTLAVIVDMLQPHECLKLVHMRSIKNETALLFAAAYPDSLKQLIKILSTEEFLAQAFAMDSNHQTMLHRAVRKVESLQIIIGILSKQQFINLLLMQPGYHNTLLMSPRIILAVSSSSLTSCQKINFGNWSVVKTHPIAHSSGIPSGIRKSEAYPCTSFSSRIS